MEILIRSARRLAFGFCVLLAFIVLLSFSGVSAKMAYADNDSAIGANGGSIEIAEVSSTESGYYAPSQFVRYKITCPRATTNIYIAFDIDTAWAIGDEESNEDTPYIEVTGAGSTESEEFGYKCEWTDFSEVYEMQVMHLNVSRNGTLFVKAKLSGEETPLEATSIVKRFDLISPTIKVDEYGGRAVGNTWYNENGKKVFRCRATFTDYLSAKYPLLNSTNSGLNYVMLFYTTQDLSEDTVSSEDDVENSENYTKLLEWSPLSGAVQNVTLDFNVSVNGYYFYLVGDRVGNVELGNLFTEKFTGEQNASFIIQTTGGTHNDILINHDVTDIMERIEVELSDNAGKVNPTIYAEASQGYAELYMRFMTTPSDASDAVRRANSVAYNEYYSGKYAAFKTAIDTGKATYELVIAEGKELLPGELTCANLNSSFMSGLAGDKIVAEIYVTKLAPEDYVKEVADRLTINARVVYRLSYTLKVNGVQSLNVPTTPLIFDLRLPAEYTDVEMYSSVNGSQYAEKQFSKGVTWLRFQSALTKEEIHVACAYPEDDKPKLTWLWITLPCVCVPAIGVATFFILLKKGVIKLPKKGAPNGETSEEEGKTTEEETPASTQKAKKKPKNKSKK